MTKMWAIQATVTDHKVGVTNGVSAITRQVPTFYLHPTVQGILSADHAVRVASNVISTFIHPTERAEITAVEVEL